MRIYIVEYGYEYDAGGVICVTTNEELARKCYNETGFGEWVKLSSCDQNNNNWVLLAKKEQ